MALALYRKYRPASFADVVGQAHVTDPLRTALAAGRINHAYLFSGPRGCGKTTSARILARSLNCVQGPTPDPCGVCASCIALAPEGPGSLDVVELDAASHGGVDDTRDLRDKAFYMPAESRFRVFIIDEAHMVSPQGFNALLKIVEEPPEHLVFIFATTEPDKVLTTIRSRTHHYPFRLIPPATLRALLEKLCAEEGVTVEPTVYPLVIQAGGGSARDCLSVLDQLLAGAGPEGVTYAHAVSLLGVTDAALLDEMVDALAADDGASVFGAVDRVVEAGHDPRRFAADLLRRTRDLLILAAVPDARTKGLIDAPEDQLTAMAGQAERLGTATLSRFGEVLHTGLVDMRGTTAPRLVLELMCARMLLPAASSSDAALLQRLERMERRMAIAGEAGPVEPTRGARREVVAVDPPPSNPPARPAVTVGSAQPARPIVTTPPGPTPTEVQPGSDGPPGAATAPAPADSPRRSGRPIADTRADGPRAAGSRADGARADAAMSGPDLQLPAPPVLSSRRPRPPAVDAPATVRPDSAPAGPDIAPAGPDGAPAPSVASIATPASAPSGSPGSGGAASDPPPADAPAPDPPAPPGSAPFTAVGVTDVRRVWAEVLTVVKEKRRTTQAMLDSATVADLDGSTLVLTVPSAALGRRVMEAGNVDVLRAALRQVLGVDWRIRCQAPAEHGPAGGRSPSGAAPAGGFGPPVGSGPAGSGPVAGPSGRDRTGRASGPPPEPDDDDIPEDYGAPPDPDTPVTAPRDPEEVAIELLASQLGARRLEA